MSDATRIQALESQVKSLQTALRHVLQLTGNNTMTGRLFLSQDPQGDLEAATKHYVDYNESGFTGTLVLAKITPGGTNGTAVVTKGRLTTLAPPT